MLSVRPSFFSQNCHWPFIFSIFAIICWAVVHLSSKTQPSLHAEWVYGESVIFWTPKVVTQMQWYVLGIFTFLFFSYIDYRTLHSWAWFAYGFSVFLLGITFLSPSIQGVQRWIILPGGLTIQPGEYVRIALALLLSDYFHRPVNLTKMDSRLLAGALFFTGLPFFIITRQPDLGTALLLWPMFWSMVHYSRAAPLISRIGILATCTLACLITLLFLEIIPFAAVKPYFALLLKPYQIERLNPNTYHQIASKTAVAIGGLWGKGRLGGDYSNDGWLPEPTTDSVFASFCEEYGLVGGIALLSFFYTIIVMGLQTFANAKDRFGRFLALGLTVNFSASVLINLGTVVGFLPMTGVPLPLMTYGGSSVVATLAALGILHSIYLRRYMFS